MKALKIVSYLLRTGHFPLGRRIDQGTEEVGDSRSLDVKVGGVRTRSRHGEALVDLGAVFHY